MAKTFHKWNKNSTFNFTL